MMSCPTVLCEPEVDKLVKALIKGNLAHGKDGLSEDSVSIVLKWAKEVRVNQAILEGLLSGRLTVTIDEAGELMLSRDTEEVTGR